MSIRLLSEQGLQIFRQSIAEADLKVRKIKQGEELLRQGQEITELYWVELGEFTIEYIASNGRKFSLGLNFVDHHLFGEDEFLTESLCQFNVCSVGDFEVKVIPSSVMLDLMQQHPTIGIWLSSYLSKRYQDGMYGTMNRFLHPLMYNVALDFYERHLQLKPEVSFDCVTKEAARFGCSERVYRRVVKQLIEMDMLKKRGSCLVISDLGILSKFISSTFH